MDGFFFPSHIHKQNNQVRSKDFPSGNSSLLRCFVCGYEKESFLPPTTTAPQKIDAPGGARLFPRACSGAHENNWRHSHSNDFCRMDERRYQRGEAIWIILFYAWPTKAPTLSLSTPFASRTLAHSFQKCNIKSEPNIAHV